MCKTAKAAVFVGVDESFVIREYPLVAAPEGMARLRLVASGICGTDIHIHKGKIGIAPPKVIGHEFVGLVEEISEADAARYGISVGDHAIVNIACPCGECLLCKEGDDANCLNMGVTNGGDPEKAPHFWGGYGEYNYSPVKNLIKIPAELDPQMVCVFACAGPTALHAFHLARKANCQIDKARTAVVQGLGPVGIFAVMYLKTLGIQNILAITAGNNEEREKLARKLGASEVFNLTHHPTEEITARIRQISGIGADLVFEASGNPKAVPQGLEMLRNRGVYLVPGQYSNSGQIEVAPQMITFNALHIIGSSQYSVSDVKNYLEFLLANTELHDTIASLASTYTVDNINEALDDAKSGKNIKTMLV